MKIKRDWGLVLAGGGGKGAYEIGAWKALLERKQLRISAVSGTSVGALNAALFSAGSLGKAETIWGEQIDQEVVLTPDFFQSEEAIHKLRETIKENKEWLAEWSELGKIVEITADLPWGKHPKIKLPWILYPGILFPGIVYPWALRGKRELIHGLEEVFEQPLSTSVAWFIGRMIQKGVFSREGLSQIILKNDILPQVMRSEIDCYATCYNLSTQSAEYFLLQKYREQDMLDILLASSALPLIFPPQKIRGQKYWDGGLKDNVPIRPLYEAGYRKMLVVHLDQEDADLFSGTAQNFQKTDLVFAQETQLRYPDATLVHFYPQKSLSGFLGMLDFHPRTIHRKMKQGYTETKKRLEQLSQVP